MAEAARLRKQSTSTPMRRIRPAIAVFLCLIVGLNVIDSKISSQKIQGDEEPYTNLRGRKNEIMELGPTWNAFGAGILSGLLEVGGWTNLFVCGEGECMYVNMVS